MVTSKQEVPPKKKSIFCRNHRSVVLSCVLPGSRAREAHPHHQLISAMSSTTAPPQTRSSTAPPVELTESNRAEFGRKVKAIHNKVEKLVASLSDQVRERRVDCRRDARCALQRTRDARKPVYVCINMYCCRLRNSHPSV